MNHQADVGLRWTMPSMIEGRRAGSEQAGQEYTLCQKLAEDKCN